MDGVESGRRGKRREGETGRVSVGREKLGRRVQRNAQNVEKTIPPLLVTVPSNRVQEVRNLEVRAHDRVRRPLGTYAQIKIPSARKRRETSERKGRTEVSHPIRSLEEHVVTQDLRVSTREALTSEDLEEGGFTCRLEDRPRGKRVSGKEEEGGSEGC